MPEPTEESILSRTLLAPSALPTILPLQDFANLFPTSQRAHPQIKVLYRDLQHRRNLDLDYVKQNVVSEARRGEHQRRELAKTRWRDAKGDRRALDLDLEDDAAMREDGMEGLLYGSSSSSREQKPHSLATVVPALESACEEVDAEIAELDAEAEELTDHLKSTIGNLSDLRYGKLSRPSLRDETSSGLRALDEVTRKA